MAQKLCYTILALGIVILFFYVKEKIKAYSIKSLILKAAVSCCFMGIAAAAAMDCTKPVFAFCTIMGLLLGLLGDIWLDLKFVHPEADAPYTFAGFWSFAIGHALFITGLLATYADFSKPLYFIIPVVVATVVGIGNVYAGPIMKLDYGKFANITKFYGSILFSMTLIAGSLALMNGFGVKTLNLMFIGGVSFIISDLVLSGTYFGKGHEKPIDFILNYVFYYGAQFIIAFSILFA
ncbi:MAG: lysoplasmalogenase family protein [Bacillota bacterium]|nr:lysoplasmalogenase family protein [Bacillota bacterium]